MWSLSWVPSPTQPRGRNVAVPAFFLVFSLVFSHWDLYYQWHKYFLILIKLYSAICRASVAPHVIWFVDGEWRRDCSGATVFPRQHPAIFQLLPEIHTYVRPCCHCMQFCIRCIFPNFLLEPAVSLVEFWCYFCGRCCMMFAYIAHVGFFDKRFKSVFGNWRN